MQLRNKVINHIVIGMVIINSIFDHHRYCANWDKTYDDLFHIFVMEECIGHNAISSVIIMLDA
jgi:hypothetical protein